MRLKLKLKLKDSRIIPVNYNYQLSSAIYNLLQFGSSEFSEFLHNEGFKIEGRNYKLFTFALRIKKPRLYGNLLEIVDSEATLYITTPIAEKFIKSFVIGTFSQKRIEINGDNIHTVFNIDQMEIVPEPEFSEEMKFISMSPIILSTKKIYDGKLKQYYLRPEDSESINNVLTNNLINKYKLIYNKEQNEDRVELEWDENYLSKNKRITKKITLNVVKESPQEVIGMQAPFFIRGNPELIKIGYMSGFGEKNSMGFGMAEVRYA